MLCYVKTPWYMNGNLILSLSSLNIYNKKINKTTTEWKMWLLYYWTHLRIVWFNKIPQVFLLMLSSYKSYKPSRESIYLDIIHSRAQRHEAQNDRETPAASGSVKGSQRLMCITNWCPVVRHCLAIDRPSSQPWILHAPRQSLAPRSQCH